MTAKKPTADLFKPQVTGNPAQMYAELFVANVVSCSELMFMGWTYEQLLETLTDCAQGDAGDELSEPFDRESARAFIAATDDQKAAATFNAMCALAAGLYRQVGSSPRLSNWARRFFGLMVYWWPENVAGVPEFDYSEHASEHRPACAVCKRQMGRFEEFRIIVYIRPTSSLRVDRTRVPICWSCLMGANANPCSTGGN